MPAWCTVKHALKSPRGALSDVLVVGNMAAGREVRSQSLEQHVSPRGLYPTSPNNNELSGAASLVDEHHGRWMDEGCYLTGYMFSSSNVGPFCIDASLPAFCLSTIPEIPSPSLVQHSVSLRRQYNDSDGLSCPLLRLKALVLLYHLSLEGCGGGRSKSQLTSGERRGAPWTARQSFASPFCLS